MNPRRAVWARWAIRVAVLALLGLWFGYVADLDDLGAALRRLSPWAAVAALGLGAVNTGVAAARWRVLMRAFGADPPPLPGLCRVYLVGLFYNTFVPGAVGGDIVRGVISRKHFRSAAASYVVVALERLIGLSALGLVFLAGLVLAWDEFDLRGLVPWGLGLLAAGLAVLWAARWTGRLATWWGQVPRVERPLDLVAAFLVSLLGHAINIAIFAVLARGAEVPVNLKELAVVVPLAFVASVLPVALAGIGPREAAFVGLLRLRGVPEAQSLALSLGYASVVLVLAGLGGLLQLIGAGTSGEKRRGEDSPPERPPPSPPR